MVAAFVLMSASRFLKEDTDHWQPKSETDKATRCGEVDCRLNQMGIGSVSPEWELKPAVWGG